MRTGKLPARQLLADIVGGAEPAFETVLVAAAKVEYDHEAWGMKGVVPGTGIEPVRLAARDFKSLVSTNFTIRAGTGL